MASRFWVGGSGNWDAATTTNWSATSGGVGGASVPTSADTVTFDANSGTAATVTVTASAACSSLTLNKSDLVLSLSAGLTVSGSMTLTAGTFTPNTQTVTINSASATLTGAWSFYNLTRTPATPAKTDTLVLASNITVTNLLTISDGATVTNRVLVSSSSVGTPRTITAAAVSISNADFQDITAAGAANWDLSAITGLSGDCGGNSGITFTTPATQTWTNVNGGNWSTAANWSGRVPLPQDDVSMACAFGTSKTVTADMPRLGASIGWTGATWTTGLTWAMSTASTLYGSLTMIAGLTMSGTSTSTFAGRGSYIFDSKGLTFARSITFNAPGGTLTLAGDLTMGATNTLTLTAGTFNCANGAINYAISAGFIYPSATTSIVNFGSATHLLTGVGTVLSVSGSATITGTGMFKITDTSASAVTVTGGTNKIYTMGVWFARGASTATNTLSSGGNTWSEIKDTGTAAHSLLFTAGGTTTVGTWTVSGNPGALITLDSTTTGTYTLTKTGYGAVSADYLVIKHCIATGGPWFAGTHSTDSQSTATAGSGWIFRAAPVPVAGTLGAGPFTRALGDPAGYPWWGEGA